MYAEYKAAGLGINWRLAAMLPNVVVMGCTCPRSINAARQVDHEKRVACFSYSLHACGSDVKYI